MDHWIMAAIADCYIVFLDYAFETIYLATAFAYHAVFNGGIA